MYLYVYVKMNWLALAVYKGRWGMILREAHLLEHNLENIVQYHVLFWPVMVEKIHSFQE